MQAIFCPQCNSSEVDYLARRDGYVCAACNHFFKAAKAVEPLRIFLSYGHDDKAFIASQIKHELEALGHAVWYDLDRLKAGRDWEEYIQQGLEWVAEAPLKARFILLMTPHSVRRPNGFCLNELARALEKQVAIFPVMLEWCEPPLSICRIQWLDMRQAYSGADITGKFAENVRELTQALEYNKSDFDGASARLRTILDPIPFEATALMHIRRFVGREWMLGKIDDWLNNAQADKIFWITGDPGIGKSAWASWLHFYHPNIKAFFLCKAPSNGERGIYEPGDPRWCVRTIAFHLSAMLPDYRNRLNQLDLERIVKESSAEAMCERLIVEALFGIRFPDEQRVVVLIDGLDEVTRKNRNELAEFLVRQFPKTPDWLRAIITSRYEEPLISDLQRYKPFKMDAEETLNAQDQRQFIAKEFTKFTPDEHLPASTVQTLLAKSEGNFLYLEQVRDALEKGHLALNELESFPQGLGEFYKYFFSRRFPAIREFRDCLYDKLAVILAASTPLHWEEAESLFGWQKGCELKEFKSLLGSLFKYDQNQIRPFHQSLLEWLTNEQKAGDFWIRLNDGHNQLARTGYAAYKSQTTTPTPGELKCIRELPDHLLVTKELDKLAEFLTDLEVFVTYFGDNIHSYINYWNALCREDKQKRWTLPDCPKLLSQKVDSCRLFQEANPHTSEAYASLGRLFFELKEYEDAARMFQKAMACFPQNGDDATRARLYNDIGEALIRVGKTDEAEPHYRQALEIRRQIFIKHPDLAESIGNYGHVFFYRSMYEKALECYREELTMWKSLPDGPHCGEANSYNNIALSLQNIGKDEEAKTAFKECADVLDRLDDPYWGIPICRNNYGDFLQHHGQLVEAEWQYRLAYEFSMRIYGPEDNSTINSASKLAMLYFNSGQHDKAISQFKEVSETCAKLYGPYHPKTIQTLNLMGEGLMHAGKHTEARDLLLDMVNRIGKSDVQDSEVNALALHDMGAACFYLRNYDESLQYLLQAIKLREDIYPAGHEYILRTYQFALEAYVQKRDLIKAAELAEQCYQMHIPPMACDSHSYYNTQVYLGRVLRIAQKWENARTIYQNVIENGEKLLRTLTEKPSSGDSRIADLSQALHDMGAICFNLGNYDEALQDLLQAIKLREDIYPAGHQYILSTYQLAVETCMKKNDVTQAAVLAEKCYQMHNPPMACDSDLYYNIQMDLARMLRIAGKWEKARKIYDTVIENGEKLLPTLLEKPSSNDLRIFNLAVAYNEIAFYEYVPEHNWREAETFYRRAIELMATQNNDIELANAQLNLCTVLHQSGKAVDDGEVRRITEILEKAQDSRAAKGKKILQDRGA